MNLMEGGSEPQNKVEPPSTRRSPSRPATIRDVALLAGVGPITVSRVVRNQGYVATQTREKVEAAVKQLGYRPNGSARSLRMKRSNTIALIVSDITNPFFTTIARGVEDVAIKHGYLVLFGNTDEDVAAEARYMDLLLSKGVDGILLVPAAKSSSSFELASESGLPCVVIDRRAPAGFDCVRCDSTKGSRDAAKLLLDHGHLNVAVLAGPVGLSTSDDRIEAFRNELESGGGRVAVLHGRMTVAEGRRLAIEALGMPVRPTALFAVNNFLMFGGLSGIEQLGLRAGTEVSLVGFDDVPVDLSPHSDLTVVSQPAYELGVKAAERLMARIQNPQLEADQVLLPTTMLVRNSVGKAL